MAKRRLSPNQMAELKANFAGLKQIEGYAPRKDEYKITQIQPLETELDDLLLQESQLLVQLGNLRDRIADVGTDFQQKIKGAAQQVVAQFGDDSPEYQSMGRKRTSERAAGRRSKSTNAPKG